MAEDARDEVEKFLADQRSIEARKQKIIDELLRQKTDELKKLDQQKADVAKAFDEKLRALGHSPDSAAPRRSHKAKRPAVEPANVAAAKPKDKTT